MAISWFELYRSGVCDTKVQHHSTRDFSAWALDASMGPRADDGMFCLLVALRLTNQGPLRTNGRRIVTHVTKRAERPFRLVVAVTDRDHRRAGDSSRGSMSAFRPHPRH
jgi:hypothetical protein